MSLTSVAVILIDLRDGDDRSPPTVTIEEGAAGAVIMPAKDDGKVIECKVIDGTAMPIDD